MVRHNPAHRLSVLLRTAAGHGSTTAAADVWAEILKVTGDDVTVKDQEVARLLTLARNELETVRQALERAHAERSLYQTHFNRLANALSLRVLSTGWDHAVKPNLQDSALTALDFAAFILGDEEGPVPASDLESVKKAAGQIRAEVTSPALSAEVRDFLLRQIETIERAVREYPIRGAAAFRDASNSAAVDWIEHADLVRDVATNETVQKTAKLVDRLKVFNETAGVFARTLSIALWLGGGTLTGIRVIEAAVDDTPVWTPLANAAHAIPGAQLLLPPPSKRPDDVAKEGDAAPSVVTQLPQSHHNH